MILKSIIEQSVVYQEIARLFFIVFTAKHMLFKPFHDSIISWSMHIINKSEYTFSIFKFLITSSLAFVFLHVTPHDRTLVLHYMVDDMYLHYGLSPIN